MKRSIVFFSLLLFLLCLPIAVHAQTRLESNNYKIQFPNLNSGAGIPSSSNYLIDSTIGQTTAGLYSSSGYRVRAGFQYIHTIIPFSFSISDISIDFGTLTVQTPSTDNSTITVKAGGAGGYAVKARENHSLQNQASTAIPDTICDNGNCTQTSAEVWSQNTTYGFGFNMDGDDVPADFTDTTYFRHFADASSAEDPETIMSKAGVTWDYPNNTWPWESEATITYKVNISSTQAAGVYQNMITYTAIPAY